MVSILLLILKIILYIILGILLLLLLVLLTVLFVPIRYEVSGEKYDQLILDGRVSWLFKIFRVSYHMGGETNYYVKIFFKTIMTSDEEPKSSIKTAVKGVKKKKDDIEKEDIGKNKDSGKDKAVKENEVEVKEDKDEAIKSHLIEKEDKSSQTTIKPEADKDQKNKNKKSSLNKTSSKKTKKKSKKDKKKKAEKEESKVRSILGTVKDFLGNDEYNGVIKFLLGRVVKIIKSILPTKVRLNAVVGTGDPATTGYAVGGVSILYAVTDNSIKVTPNFHDKVFEGEFYVKGRIFLFIIAANGVRIILDKRVRRLIAEYNK